MLQYSGESLAATRRPTWQYYDKEAPMHPWLHSQSSARKYGGKPSDYLPIHNWFDASKAFMSDFRHRALRHHTEGIFMAESVFGSIMTNSDGKIVPVRLLGENHVYEDLGCIPTPQDWFKHIQPEEWMHRAGKLLSPEPSKEPKDVGLPS